ncbi:STAS domain-containing protein [Leptolyngbya sp. AN03gr2]|uniref:STAS domain-containing protein n=1 Tax=unclassified Leptolyngbya TaxID=2650499 RepID=UPI003D313464
MELLTRTIQFPETLDDMAIAQFHEQANEAVHSDSDAILVDFAKVEFMSSPGLMALVIAFKRSREAGKPMLLQSVNERIRMLLELTGMDKVFEIMESPVEESEQVLVN